MKQDNQGTLVKTQSAETGRTLVTTKYDQFRTIRGNRQLNQKHIRQLMLLMEAHGNLTQDFPVVVNEKLEVIDGQHRIEALKRLHWPVHYRVQSGLGLGTVQDINQAQRNWNYLDYAASWAARGNKHYQKFLAAFEEFGGGYRTLAIYLSDPGTVHAAHLRRDFLNGDFQVPDYEHSREMLVKLEDVKEMAGFMTNRMAAALYLVFRHPDYEHKRLLRKLELYGGSQLRRYSSLIDNLRMLEDLYNHKQEESSHVRFF